MGNILFLLNEEISLGKFAHQLFHGNKWLVKGRKTFKNDCAAVPS